MIWYESVTYVTFLIIINGNSIFLSFLDNNAFEMLLSLQAAKLPTIIFSKNRNTAIKIYGTFFIIIFIILLLYVV